MARQKEIKLTPFYKDYVFQQPYKVIIQVGGRFSSKSYNSEIEMACNLADKTKKN
jgi:phage terminase large subunit